MPTQTQQYQYVKLPDGSYGKFDANATDDEIRGRIQRDFPNAFPTSSAVSRFSRSAAESSGLSTVGNAIAHLPTTAGTVVDAARRIVSRGQPTRMADNPNPIISSVGRMVDSTTSNAKQAYDDYKAGNPSGAVSHAVSAIPV